jgi:ESS family glutamate:Na+ symporter
VDWAQFISHVYSALMLAVVFVVAYTISRAPTIRRFYLPASLVAGVLLLVLGPQVAGKYFSDFQISQFFYDVWAPLPGILINVVFACLFLGHPPLSIKKIWKLSGSQIAFGQMIAWGQYLVGGLVTLLVLIPLFNVVPVTASLLEVSFEGGHGTVVGLGPVFNDLNYQIGQEIAYGLATASLVTTLILGVILIQWGRHRGLMRPDVNPAHQYKKSFYNYTLVHDIRKKALRLVDKHMTVWKLIKQIALVAISIFVGWLLREGLVLIDQVFLVPHGLKFFSYVPLFSICMFGGLIVNYACIKLNIRVSSTANSMISDLALGVLIMTAVGTMSLGFFNGNAGTFWILYAAGSIWIISSVLILARRMFHRYWFQNAVVSFGQAMGMTATGLLFAQMVDPKNRTGAVDAFGYKQMLFEPFMGGGLITAVSMPLIMAIGLPIFTAICGGIVLFWMLMGLFYFGRRI